MFKISKKITSLLVAIAAVVSIAPATIANASDKLTPATAVNASDKSETTATKTSNKLETYHIGWLQLANGTWNFYDALGNKITNHWVDFGGTWYYLKADSVPATGWYDCGNAWYYFDGSGAMLSNTVIDGCKLNASGAWVK